MDYRFDRDCADWNAERAEHLGCALIRAFREMPGLGFHFSPDGSISIQRLHLLNVTTRDSVVRRAEAIYRIIMIASREAIPDTDGEPINPDL